jgi:hypothetical protein
MLASRQNIYLACEDMNFTWDEVEVLEFEKIWNAGMGLFEIAGKLQRDPDEVAILIIDRSRQRRIKPRLGGIWGDEYFEIRKCIEGRKDGNKPCRRKGSGTSKADDCNTEGVGTTEAG